MDRANQLILALAEFFHADTQQRAFRHESIDVKDLLSCTESGDPSQPPLKGSSYTIFRFDLFSFVLNKSIFKYI